MILKYIADENRIQPILVEVPGKEDEEAPTIHLARVGRNHYHAGIPVALHSRNALPEYSSSYHSHALPIATNSSGRAYKVGNTGGYAGRCCRDTQIAITSVPNRKRRYN
jgi:hypothetical protein